MENLAGGKTFDYPKTAIARKPLKIDGLQKVIKTSHALWMTREAGNNTNT